ncbi:MAG: hypothetical protein KAV45_14650 [Calditrichia bacterium]|nr:hypothetical protein [Calditrichia bacterium]
MNKLFVKKQIQKFQYPPFKNLLNLWIAKKYMYTSLTFILIIIIPAVFIYFLLGIILFSPFLSIIQGFTVGNIISNFDKKSMIWAIIVGVFEFGYWSLSGALGIYVTISILSSEISFIDSLSNCVEILFSVYWIPLIFFIIGNAFLEVAGPVYWNIKGVISLEDLSKAQNIYENT